MKKERPLTIDPIPTKANIKSDGRTVYSYARLRGFAEGTFSRILDGRYPHNEDLKSVYQQALRALEKDGYLVQICPESQAA